VPPHIRWLLLGIAFVIVLILLVLLLPGSQKKAPPPVERPLVTESTLYVGPAQIEWLNVDIGDTRTKKIVISASTETKISQVKFANDNIPGLSLKTDCTSGLVAETVTCGITVDWAPASETPTTVTKIQIPYYSANAPESATKMKEIPIVISTRPIPVYVPPPAPVMPEPLPMPPAPLPGVITGPGQEQNGQVPDNSAAQNFRNDTLSTEACYEFAFPGYNAAGVQSGWIRPENGRYMFHLFTDTECAHPIGEYNPLTGMITALDDPSKKIGTDAEHIGWGIGNAALSIPALSNPAAAIPVNRAMQLDAPVNAEAGPMHFSFSTPPRDNRIPSSLANGKQATVSSEPYDRTFVLRQYKPIPATIVNEIRATKNASRLPVQATVDRNVYSDNGRTVIIPAGTLMIGAVADTDLPGPYKAIGRINIEWYRFVRPDGVEFNFGGERPFSADSQGRTGVPGRGSTDYLEQFFMPMITALIPAAVNMIAPISDKFVNQIDLDNNTVVQTGTVRSSELAKNEIITTWNKVAEKLAMDLLDNQVPPFSIAAGTRITVFSPNDLIVVWCDEAGNCTPNTKPDNGFAPTVPGADAKGTPLSISGQPVTIGATPENYESMIGQVRSFELSQYCNPDGSVRANPQDLFNRGIDYRTVVALCQQSMYQAKNNAAWNAYYGQAQAGNATTSIPPAGATPAQNTPQYNQQVLGIKTDATGKAINPLAPVPAPTPPPAGATPPNTVTCDNNMPPDAHGCCPGETYTDMGEQGFNCCPTAGGDCFPPIKT